MKSMRIKGNIKHSILRYTAEQHSRLNSKRSSEELISTNSYWYSASGGSRICGIWFMCIKVWGSLC